MGLADKDKVDIIAKRPDADAFDLIAVDDGSEMDEVRRYNLVVEKLGNYLTYVRSGQFEASYPEARGKDVRCVIMCFRPPNDAMKRLHAVKDPADTNWRLPVVVSEHTSLERSAERPAKPWWRFW